MSIDIIVNSNYWKPAMNKYIGKTSKIVSLDVLITFQDGTTMQTYGLDIDPEHFFWFEESLDLANQCYNVSCFGPCKERYTHPALAVRAAIAIMNM